MGRSQPWEGTKYAAQAPKSRLMGGKTDIDPMNGEDENTVLNGLEVERLEAALQDLQSLADQMAVGEVRREDLVWRLNSYFSAVKLVLDETARGGALDARCLRAVALLRAIHVSVRELILSLSENAEVARGGLPHGGVGVDSIVPFPTMVPAGAVDDVGDDDTW